MEDITKTNDQPSSFKVEIAPRRLSLTQRLVGQSREWMQNFHASQEEDDQLYGQGFNDTLDDYIPGVMYNNAQRRRTSSTSSDSSDLGSPARVRTNSIAERVAGMQLNRKPKTPLESYAIASATVIDQA